jgi:glycosyltransferase involved in cell wall biosynthesis
MATRRPVRILHVFGGMERGGAETAFMEFLRHIDRAHFKMDVLVHTMRHCYFDDEIRALGSRIIPCLHPNRPLTYARRLKDILREDGPYNILHSHVEHFSGYVLRVAAQRGVPARIAHSHSDVKRDRKGIPTARRIYFALTERWIRQYATVGLAVSANSASSLYGARWREDPRYRVLHNGIDLTPFEHADQTAVRAELGIPLDAVLVGHVGSLIPVKNHRFIIETFAAFLAQVPSAHLVLTGDGPLMPEILALAQAKGVAARVHLPGLRSDVPRVLAALDLFLFPSRFEGLPLAVLEAQAAGVPCVLSDTITREVDLELGLLRFLGLQAGTQDWVDALRTSLGRDKPAWTERVGAFRRCGFDIQYQVRELQTIYANALV